MRKKTNVFSSRAPHPSPRHPELHRSQSHDTENWIGFYKEINANYKFQWIARNHNSTIHLHVSHFSPLPGLRFGWWNPSATKVSKPALAATTMSWFLESPKCKVWFTSLWCFQKNPAKISAKAQPASPNFKPNVHLNATTLHRQSKASRSSDPEVVATQLQALHNNLNNKSFKNLHNPTELKKFYRINFQNEQCPVWSVKWRCLRSGGPAWHGTKNTQSSKNTSTMASMPLKLNRNIQKKG